MKQKPTTLVWTPDQDTRHKDSVLEQEKISVATAAPSTKKPIKKAVHSASEPPATRIKTLQATPAAEKPKEGDACLETPVLTEKERLRLIEKKERIQRGKEFRKQRTLDNQAKIHELAKEHDISYDHAHLVYFGQWKLSRALRMKAKLAKLAAAETECTDPAVPPPI